MGLLPVMSSPTVEQSGIFTGTHKITSTPEESAALEVNNGCDLTAERGLPASFKRCRTGLLIKKRRSDQALSPLTEDPDETGDV